MKPLLLIYNPNAGKGSISTHLNDIIQTLTSYHWICICYPTQKRGDGKRIAQTIGQDFQRVVCAGGDGTLSEVSEGLLCLENPPPLAYIPFGSTNDSANTFQLPKDPLAACRIAATGRAVRQDTGTLNEKPFLYVAAFGAFSAVSYEVSQDWKNLFGNLAYVMGGVASLTSITPYTLKIDLDGDEIQGDFFYGMVCNSYTVGGLPALPRDTVQLDDGFFEVILVRKGDGLQAALSALQSFLWKTPLEEHSVLSFRAKHIRFSSTTPIPWTVDGEFGGKHCSTIVENHQKTLTVIHGEV